VGLREEEESRNQVSWEKNHQGEKEEENEFGKEERKGRKDQKQQQQAAGGPLDDECEGGEQLQAERKKAGLEAEECMKA